MRKVLIIAGLVAAGAGLTVACSGPASADDQTVVVNESSTSTSGSTDCLPAAVLAQLPPWLLIGSVPACS